MGGPPRGALPQGRLQRVLVAGTPTSLVAGGCGGGAAVSGHPGSGCSRGRGPEAGPQGRTVQVGVALTRWRRGGPPAGPYGAETPARATARHGPARAKSTRAQMACDEPGRCVAERGHGTAWLGSGGPRSSRPGSAAAWAGAGTEVTEGGAVLPSSVAPLPRPRALSWLRPPAAAWARAGLGEDAGRTYPVTAQAGAGVRTTPRIGPHPLPRGPGWERRRSLLAIPALTTTRARGAVRGADW